METRYSTIRTADIDLETMAEIAIAMYRGNDSTAVRLFREYRTAETKQEK